MKINKIIIKTIGEKRIKQLVYLKKYCLSIFDFLNGSKGKITISDEIDGYKVFSLKGNNVFFGYYDLNQFNSNGEKLLAHVTPRMANPMFDDAQLVWIDPVTSEFHEIAKTKAWCWQQGARLRWHPLNDNIVLFNDYINGKYVLKQTDIESGNTKIISDALYDIDCNFKYGIKVNFERLQRLRPGYGYSRIGDETANVACPAYDGITRIDLATGTEELLFSLEKLAEDIPQCGEHHYINHVSFSPSGNQFMFFHLWTKKASSPWNMRFYVCNSDGSNLRMLEDGVRISHYHWVDEENIIATRIVCDNKYEYVKYNVLALTKQIIESDLLCIDGHPNLLLGGFITDTYPQVDRMQYLFVSDFAGKKCREIAGFYANPICFGEHRCDLHPRVYNNSMISVDCTYNSDVRCIVCLSIKNQTNFNFDAF